MAQKLKSIFALAGTVCGLIVLILGIAVCCKDTGNWQNTVVSFGGDFYSYSYKATATAANNITELAAIAKTGLGCLLIAFGLFDICYFGSKASTSIIAIVENMPKKLPVVKTEESVADDAAAPEAPAAAPVDPKVWIPVEQNPDQQ